jgi:hypothetical protein
MACLAFMAGGAQASGPAAPTGGTDSTPVVVDLSGTMDPRADTGVLVRSDTSSAAPAMAVYLGLSLLAATLTVIAARRRLLAVRASELATGVVIGRRHRAEFWSNVGTRPQYRPEARSAPPRLLGSTKVKLIAEHGPPVRAGYRGRATDG